MDPNPTAASSLDRSGADASLVNGVRLLAPPDVVAGAQDWPPVWFSFAQHR